MEPVGAQLPLAAAAAATEAPEAAIGRTRTFFVFITGADAGDQERVCFCAEERDWMNLPELVVSTVAEIALRTDVTDYIRLRAVCKPWRVVSKADPKFMGMDPRCFPRNWDIIDKGARREGKTRFMHSLTGASIWLKIPPEYGKVIASAEGCLILASGRGCEHKLRLFNPVTRAVAELPNVPWDSKITSAGFIYDDGHADVDPTVVLCTEDPTQRIVYNKPGDTEWRIVDYEEEHGELLPYSAGGLSVRGRFYVPTPTGNLRMLEPRPRPHLVHVARQEARHRCGCCFGARSWLEDDGDGRMLLLRYIDDRVEMFMVDFTDDKGSLTLVEDQEDIYNCFRPLLALGSMSSD
ncbi:hypothetical protein ACQ4PT_068537 [Festuca glaucescens]